MLGVYPTAVVNSPVGSWRCNDYPSTTQRIQPISPADPHPHALPAQTTVTPMRNFTMYFEDDGLGEPRRIEFKGPDPLQALHIAKREDKGRTIALFEGDKKLGTIKRLGPELWHLS
jgi:hypothetical protein